MTTEVRLFVCLVPTRDLPKFQFNLNRRPKGSGMGYGVMGNATRVEMARQLQEDTEGH